MHVKTIKVKEQFLEVRFEIEKKENGYKAKLDDYGMEEKEEITFFSESKKDLKKTLKKWIAELIEDYLNSKGLQDLKEGK